MEGISWFHQIKSGHNNAFRIHNMYNLRQPFLSIQSLFRIADHFILISTSRLCARSLELCPTLNVNLPLGIRQICRLTSQTDKSFLRYTVSFLPFGMWDTYQSEFDCLALPSLEVRFLIPSQMSRGLFDLGLGE